MAYYNYYGGGDMMKTDQQWYESFMALSTQLSEVNKKLEIMELTTQVSELTKRIDAFGTQASQRTFVNCQLCERSHLREGCPYNLQSIYFVANSHMQQSYSHSNFYNPS
ncbi:hypothetical protein PanWU01x14_266210 [Parasponia andersonii]|uniref:Uncharacterized protein n=1 Tax=Parasponia andersonii TaxID=3476 RepID=A0A2P5B6Z3_PARAD|nr:hypothetical protein PanWU01x14_266210 [Parasponia andersonii]